MALKTNTGYVRISFSTGLDASKLHVNWYTYRNENWREENPFRVWASISEQGSYVFDLVIKENSTDPNSGEITENIVGYLPQTIEQAHELLKNLSGKECNFKSVNFQIV